MSELEQKCRAACVSGRDLIVLIAFLTLREKILKHKTMSGKKKARMKGRMRKLFHE